MHRKVAVAIAAALALTVASCGGSGTTSLNRAELVRRMEVACREAQATATRTARAANGTDPIAAIQSGQKALMARVEELDASASAKADFADYKAALRDRLVAIERVVAASRAERSRVLRSVEREAAAASRRIETAARGLGLKNCG